MQSERARYRSNPLQRKQVNDREPLLKFLRALFLWLFEQKDNLRRLNF